MNDLVTNWSTQIKKGYLELCLLAMLDRQKQSYGFEILSLLANQNIDIKEGTLYPMLNRMTKEGWLKAKWVTEDLQGHPRKFYSLTVLGKKVLAQMDTQYQQMFTIYQKIYDQQES